MWVSAAEDISPGTPTAGKRYFLSSIQLLGLPSSETHPTWMGPGSGTSFPYALLFVREPRCMGSEVCLRCT